MPADGLRKNRILITGPVGHVHTVLDSHVEVSVATRRANCDQVYSERGGAPRLGVRLNAGREVALL